MRVFPSLLSIKRRLFPRLEVIEPLCDETSRILSRRHWDQDIFPFTTLLREVLMNAILHGCKGVNDCRIQCQIFFRKSSMSFTVKDEGHGFSWRKQLRRAVTPDIEGGRGLQILQHYAHKFTFNEQGNRIHVFRSASENSPTEVHK
ncbi:MAG: ATP-binding protein [Candidatus Riflebacteria bacterium]|nr:ATP-binding protein [Candidatus Riflebacteria bacterium]